MVVRQQPDPEMVDTHLVMVVLAIVDLRDESQMLVLKEQKIIL